MRVLRSLLVAVPLLLLAGSSPAELGAYCAELTAEIRHTAESRHTVVTPETNVALSAVTYEEPQPAVQQRCCKICRKGKACGDSCISRRYTCRKGPGCACNA